MTKRFPGILILLFFAASLFAQDDIPSRKGKFFFIPEIWLSFGSRTYIELSPMIGYHVNNRLSFGLGPHYIYQSQKATAAYPYSYEYHTFGLKGFSRFSILTNADEFLPIKLFTDLYVHVEYEVLSLENAASLLPNAPEQPRYIYQALLLGGGFSQRVGGHNAVTFTVLWDVNNTAFSPYSNPLFRVGFNSFF